MSGNPMSASLIGRLGSSAFRLSTTTVATSLAGSCFSLRNRHMGPSIMGSEDEVEQSLERPCPAAGPSGLTNSPHPSSREGHHSTAWWSSSFLLALILLSAHAVTSLVHLHSVPSTQIMVWTGRAPTE